MPKTLTEELEAAAQSEATRTSYAQALRHFKAWGGQVQLLFIGQVVTTFA